MIDFDVVKKVCEEVHVFMAEEVFGRDGVDAIYDILEFVRELYGHVEAYRIRKSVIVFRAIQNIDDEHIIASRQLCDKLDVLCHYTDRDIVLEISCNGRRYIHNISSINPVELSSKAIVYVYKDGQDYFFAGGQKRIVPILDRSAQSQFCANTFFALHEALQYYAESFVRLSSCLIFKTVWADENHLFLKNKPEKDMRRSLTQYLIAHLGAGFEVRPEQNMDESHPVDIKVTKKMSNRLMIIEIKWMGDSLDEGREKISTSYREDRANEGAKQLADYLDQNKASAPLNVTQGYYVVIDARRRGLSKYPKSIKKDDGLHYENKEIIFTTEYNKIRDDFNPPYRMFTEPKYIEC